MSEPKNIYFIVKTTGSLVVILESHFKLNRSYDALETRRKQAEESKSNFHIVQCPLVCSIKEEE